jgi:drug/metabolite transporter (DMT)-like permease
MPSEPQPTSRFEDPNAAPAVDTGFATRRLPGTRAGEHQGMLPGMAMIGMFLLLIAMMNAFRVVSVYHGFERIVLLGLCALMGLGVFGLLRLRRWGWALVTGGCLFISAAFLYMYLHTHVGPYLVQSLFSLCFFLYLVRTEVRERVR